MRRSIRSSIPAVLALLLGAAVARAEEVTFTGAPISVHLAPGRLTELVFPREVLDVISGDEVAVASKPGDAVVYLRPARPAFETSVFVRLAGGYSVPIEVREATDGRPTLAIHVRFDRRLRAIEGLARGEAEAPAVANARREPSPIALIRAMVLDRPLAGYSIVDGGGAIEVERPDVQIRRVKTWVSPVWDGLVLEIENRTDQPLKLDPLAFQGTEAHRPELELSPPAVRERATAPRYVYLAADTLAPRPTFASAEATGAHRTRVLLVRPAAKPKGTGLVPRASVRADRGDAPRGSAIDGAAASMGARSGAAAATGPGGSAGARTPGGSLPSTGGRP